MAYPAILKRGDVETTNAKHLARFGRVTSSYLQMLRGADVPRHVKEMAERFKRERFWEEPVTEPKPDIPPCPTCEEVSLAIANLRALAVHAEKTYGPTASAELIKFARWTVYLNREYEAAGASVMETP
jgi:hypothetical protein